MQRRVLAIALSLLLLLGALPLTAAAKESKVGDYVCEVTADGGIALLEYTGPGGTVTVPEMMLACPVKELGEGLFSGRHDITEVIIPQSVKQIGDSAFFDCAALEQIVLPAGLEELGAWAFYNCGLLESMEIPQGIKQIRERCFSNCIGLETVTLPSDLAQIGAFSFYFCRNLKNFEIPQSVEQIDPYAFYYCTSLEAVSLPAGVEDVAQYTFYSCSSLENITFDGQKTIGSMAFYGTAVQEVTFPQSLVSIDSHAFSHSALKTLRLEGSICAVGSEAFADTPELVDVEIADTVRGLSADMFSGSAFAQRYTAEHCLYASNHLINVSRDSATPITELTVAPGTVSIAAGACKNQIALEKLTLPASLAQIGDGAFQNCRTLQAVYYAASREAWEQIDIGTDNEALDPVYYDQDKPWDNPFSDVSEEQWFYGAVRYANENDLFRGMTETTFGPDATFTRAMLVTVLYRMQGEPQAEPISVFADVPAQAYYAQALSWAYRNGIVDGTSPSTFSPDSAISRQDFVLMLYRYAKYLNIPTDATADLSAFSDYESVGFWAKDALCWAVGEQLLQGVGDRLLPTSSATRAQAATLLMRFGQQLA